MEKCEWKMSTILLRSRYVNILCPVSISDKTYYRMIVEFESHDIGSSNHRWLRNLTGLSAAVPPRCLSNFRVVVPYQLRNPRLRYFVRSYNKTSYQIWKQDPVSEWNSLSIYYSWRVSLHIVSFTYCFSKWCKFVDCMCTVTGIFTLKFQLKIRRHFCFNADEPSPNHYYKSFRKLWKIFPRIKWYIIRSDSGNPWGLWTLPPLYLVPI